MGHENDGATHAVQLLKQRQNAERRARVEVAGSLVGKNQHRVVDQRAGDCHTLLLSARHLVRLVHHAVVQPHGVEGFLGAASALLGSDCGVVEKRQLDVLHRSGFRQQVVVLKHESDFAVAYVGALVFAHFLHLCAIDEIVARRGCVEASENVEQR